MEIKINNELGYTELIIEEKVPYKEDYQMLMLRECDINGLLTMMGRGVDDSSQYIYDISRMKSLKLLSEKEPLDDYALRQFSKQLLTVLEQVKQHMLDINKVMLHPEYIYKLEEEYYFCYYPLGNESLQQQFHGLSEFFVKVIDYRNVESVVLACDIHRASMEEQYDLAQLLEKHIEIIEPIMSSVVVDKKNTGDNLWEQTINEDENIVYEEEMEKEKKILGFIAETPLSKIWGKKSGLKAFSSPKSQKEKSKWGNWEEIIRQEEENK